MEADDFPCIASLRFVTGSIAQSAKFRYLSYSEEDYEVFRPAGDTLHRWWWNVAWRSGLEEWTFNPLRDSCMPNFTHRCNDKGKGPKNWKFYWNFTEFRSINAPQGCIPCAIFTKFAEFVRSFSTRDLLKFRWIWSRSFGVTGFKLGAGFPSSETMRGTPKIFRSSRMCSRCSITMPSFVGLGSHPPLGRPKTLSFLFVCLSITLLIVRVCARLRHEGVGLQKRFWYRWIGEGL